MSDYKQAIDLLAFIQRHPGHASQKPHGRRYGASGEALPAGHKKKDVVTGGSKAAQGRGKGGAESTAKEAGKAGAGESGEFAFIKNDKGLRDHYDLNNNCKKGKIDCEALENYTSDYMSVINGRLRGNLDKSQFRNEILYQNKIREAKETTAAMDKAFKVMPTVPNDMKVARFVSADLAAKLLSGTTFTDKGFISTTVDSNLDFKSFKGNSDWRININVRKGSKGIYLKDISGVPDENELLLPRGSQIRIINKDPKTKMITAEYI